MNTRVATDPVHDGINGMNSGNGLALLIRIVFVISRMGSTRCTSFTVIFCILFSLPVCAQDRLPEILKGNFADDYGIRYHISDTLWEQLPHAKYHIVESNAKEQYIIARNGAANASGPGLFTRIDYMAFSGMAPFEWGFCYTVYKAASGKEAREARPADRVNPRKGCGGFPFSRMKKE